ncbi:MAG: flagellar hook-length control protein FliK [Nitrospirota bacterium]
MNIRPVPPIEAAEKPIERIERLRIGELVRAVVKENTAADTLMLQIGNGVVEAKTNLALNPGDVLLLRVDSLGAEIRLRLMTGSEEQDMLVTRTLMSALAELKNLGPAARELDKLLLFFNQASPELKRSCPELGILEKLMLQAETITGGALKNAVRDSGILLETKLRVIVEQGIEANVAASLNTDLKGILLKLKHALDDPSLAVRVQETGMGPRDLGQILDRLIGHIEFQQVQSKLNDSLQLFLPFVGDDCNEAWLSFSRKGDDASNMTYSCTLNLELGRNGRVSSLINVQSGSLYIKMLCEDPAFAALLNDHAELLSQRFSVAGLRMGGFAIQVQPRRDFESNLFPGLDITV